jgi:hypothetical protein
MGPRVPRGLVVDLGLLSSDELGWRVEGGRPWPAVDPAVAMAFKLIEAAQDRWRAVNAPHLVALVRAGAVFVNGKLVERPDEHPQPEAA